MVPCLPHDVTEEEEQQALLQLQQHHHASRGGFVGGGGAGSALAALSRSSMRVWRHVRPQRGGGSMGRHLRSPSPFSRRTRWSREPPEARETPPRGRGGRRLRPCGVRPLPRPPPEGGRGQEPAAGAAARASDEQQEAEPRLRLASEEEGEAAGAEETKLAGRQGGGARQQVHRAPQLTFESTAGRDGAAPAPLSQSARARPAHGAARYRRRLAVRS